MCVHAQVYLETQKYTHTHTHTHTLIYIHQTIDIKPNSVIYSFLQLDFNELGEIFY